MIYPDNENQLPLVMKRYLVLFGCSFLLFAMCPTTLRADDHPSRKHKQGPPDIAAIVTDLTPAQKKKIEQISKEANETIRQLEASLQGVRDSLRLYMDRYEDNSKEMFPLIDREAQLLAAINKAKYRTKAAVNKVLTPEQYKQVVAHAKKHRHLEKGCDGRHEKCLNKNQKTAPAPDKPKPILKDKR